MCSLFWSDSVDLENQDQCYQENWYHQPQSKHHLSFNDVFVINENCTVIIIVISLSNVEGRWVIQSLYLILISDSNFIVKSRSTHKENSNIKTESMMEMHDHYY